MKKSLLEIFSEKHLLIYEIDLDLAAKKESLSGEFHCLRFLKSEIYLDSLVLNLTYQNQDP